MPGLGFIMNSAGVGPASYTGADVALGTWIGGLEGRAVERFYTVGDFGSSGNALGPMLVGSAATSRRGGHPFPNRDSSGRAFPLNLAGKYISITTEGGINLTGELMRIELKISQNLGDEGFRRLYEWTGLVNLRSIYIGGGSVEGVLQQQPLEQNRFIYDVVMRFHFD